MTYQAIADLATDPEFNRRLGGCLASEALGRSDALSDRIITNPANYGVPLFMPSVSAAPGFADKYTTGGQATITDGDLLSAVQASWDRIAASQTPTP